MCIFKKITVDLAERSYDITIGTNILASADKYLNLSRRVAIITDSGVPKEYPEAIATLCDKSIIITFPEGEENKTLDTYSYISQQLLSFGLKRTDAIIAVGGGIVGDVAAFVAATYLRGIDFYNIPTTLLSQVDSSIGGKCAVNFEGVKNILGAFHQPRAVIIDTGVLSTLDKRHVSAGLAEVIKMSLTSNPNLFFKLENEISENDMPEIIYSALLIKKSVVERDERERGIRKILNFGHTIGHGIEAMGGFNHGECIALGMIPMCSPKLRIRLKNLLSRLGLPTQYRGNPDKIFSYIKHDKKGDGTSIDAIFVDEPGIARIESIELPKLYEIIKNTVEV